MILKDKPEIVSDFDVLVQLSDSFYLRKTVTEQKKKKMWGTWQVTGEASREEKQGNPGCKYREVSWRERSKRMGPEMGPFLL